MSNTTAELCRYLTHGVYVIGVSAQARENAFTAAWVMQVSFSPVMLAFSINPAHYSYQLLKAGGVCTINVLEKSQLALAAHFGSSAIPDKMAGHTWLHTPSGAPALAEALVYFDCQVSHSSPAGDHEIIVCHVHNAIWQHPGQAMLYNDTGDLDGSSKLYPTT